MMWRAYTSVSSIILKVIFKTIDEVPVAWSSKSKKLHGHFTSGLSAASTEGGGADRVSFSDYGLDIGHFLLNAGKAGPPQIRW